jgi:hypothetical protein
MCVSDEALLAQQRGHLIDGEPLGERDIKGYLWSLLLGEILFPPVLATDCLY